MTTIQSRADAIQMVSEILQDASRNDRFLRVEGDRYFTTSDRVFLTGEGPEIPPHVKIPVGDNCSHLTDENWDEWAAQLLDELAATAEA